MASRTQQLTFQTPVVTQRGQTGRDHPPSFDDAAAIGTAAALLPDREGGPSDPSTAAAVPWVPDDEADSVKILDKRDTNRENGGGNSDSSPETLISRMEPGDVAVLPERSGGPFDPLGCRVQDVKRAGDIVALVDDFERPALCTLTVNRSLWLGPEFAYQSCQDRIREVMRAICPGLVWVAALEMQTKTGDGWPHWHVVVDLGSDTRSIEEIKAVVERAWCVRTESVDDETGEVVRGPREFIGFVDVREARNKQGVARYTAKYLLKAWKALPPWMLDSYKQLRKIRFSGAAFVRLAEMGLHVRHVGGRMPAAQPGRRRRRTVLERMASSGSRSILMRCEDTPKGRKLRFMATAEARWADVLSDAVEEYGPRAKVISRGGRVGAVVVLRHDRWAALYEKSIDEWAERRDRWCDYQAAKIENAWYESQRQQHEATPSEW